MFGEQVFACRQGEQVFGACCRWQGRSKVAFIIDGGGKPFGICPVRTVVSSVPTNYYTKEMTYGQVITSQGQDGCSRQGT
jgi:hypothetical protein